MKRTFAEALENRRSYYSRGSDSPVPDQEMEYIIRTAVKTRAVGLQFSIYKSGACCWATIIKNYGIL